MTTSHSIMAINSHREQLSFKGFKSKLNFVFSAESAYVCEYNV